MATVQVNKNDPLENDLVKRNDILKALVVLEEKARREWQQKWSFYQRLNELCLEEALKHGVPEEEYRRWTTRRKNKTKAQDMVWELKMSESVPRTSSGNCLKKTRLSFKTNHRTFPEQSLPDHRTFYDLRGNDKFTTKTVDRDQELKMRVLNVEPTILDFVEENPGISLSYGSFAVGCVGTLNEQVLHPYHIQKVQALKPEDLPRRIRFCMVGWRSGPEYSLERLGPLHVNPVLTLPPKEQVTHIILG